MSGNKGTEDRHGENRSDVLARDGRGVAWLKVLLSLFLIYHFAAALILPNSGSVIARRLARFFLPYANTLGLNTTWQYFSPGPGPTFYLEYQVETDENTESYILDAHRFPEGRNAFSLNDSFARRLNNMKFFAGSPERLKRNIVPFLCSQTPGARAVYIQKVMEKIAELENAQGKGSSLADLSDRYNLPQTRYPCPSPDDEMEMEMEP